MTTINGKSPPYNPTQRDGLRRLSNRFSLVADLLRLMADADTPRRARDLRMTLITQLGDIDDCTRAMHHTIFPDEEF